MENSHQHKDNVVIKWLKDNKVNNLVWPSQESFCYMDFITLICWTISHRPSRHSFPHNQPDILFHSQSYWLVSLLSLKCLSSSFVQVDATWASLSSPGPATLTCRRSSACWSSLSSGSGSLCLTSCRWPSHRQPSSASTRIWRYWNSDLWPAAWLAVLLADQQKLNTNEKYSKWFIQIFCYKPTQNS